MPRRGYQFVEEKTIKKDIASLGLSIHYHKFVICYHENNIGVPGT